MLLWKKVRIKFLVCLSRNLGNTVLQRQELKLEDIFTGQKRSHVGTVTDNIYVPVIEKGSAIITHIQGTEVHAMDSKTYSTLILPLDPEMNLKGKNCWRYIYVDGKEPDNIYVPVIEKGSAIITHSTEVHAMDSKTYSTLILPLDPEMNLEAGGEIQWMEAMGRYRITRDH